MKTKSHLTTSLLLLMFAYSMSTNLANTLLVSLVGEFSLVGEAQGSIATVNSLGAVASLISVLFLQGRLKKTTLLVFGGCLIAGMLCVCGFAPVFGLFLVAYAISGIGVGFMESCLSAAMIDLQGEKSAPYMGALHACFGIGGIVSPLLIRWISGNAGWRSAYLIFAAVFALISLQLAFACRRFFRSLGTGEKAGSGDEHRITLKDVKSYFTDPVNPLMMVAQLIVMGGQNGFTYYLVYYVSDTLNCPELGSISLTTFWVCSTISRFLYPHLRIKPLKLQGICSFIAALALLCGLLLRSGPAMLVCCAILGFVSGPGAPIIFNEGGKRMPGLTMLPVCVLSLSSYLAITIVAPTIGKIAEHTSLHIGLMLPAAMFLVGCFIGLLLNRMTERVCAKIEPEV